MLKNFWHEFSIGPKGAGYVLLNCQRNRCISRHQAHRNRDARKGTRVAEAVFLAFYVADVKTYSSDNLRRHMWIRNI